jgi:hypothetical protein
MYEEDVIVGPLSFKQLVVGLIALGIAKLVLANNSSIAAYIIAIGICLVAFVYVLRNKPKRIEIKDIKVYMQNKKMLIGEQEYVRFLNKKIAESVSYVEIRKRKGLRENPELNEVLSILQELKDEIK